MHSNIGCIEEEDHLSERLYILINKNLNDLHTRIESFELYINKKIKNLKKQIVAEKDGLREKLEDIFEFRELFKKTGGEDVLTNTL